MYKTDLALNNLQWLICHKTKANIITHLLAHRWLHVMANNIIIMIIIIIIIISKWLNSSL